MKRLISYLAVVFLVSACLNPAMAQSAAQKKLEEKRQKYLKEIRQIEGLLQTDEKKQQSIISVVENLNYKVSIRQNLIQVTNDQANYLTREINNNQNEISSLRKQLEDLKNDYAQMLVKSYKSKSEQSRVMFLLSSQNFKQAYKRFQYIQQYADYQKEQAEQIKLKTEELQQLNTKLLQQKEEKKLLVAQNRIEKEKLQSEMKQQEEVMATLKRNMSKYASDIKKRRQEIDRIDREIDRLIKAAIAESNKKAGNTTSTGKYVLTPEGKRLAASFKANKGKLGWPVSRGVIRAKYGLQPSLTDPTVKNNNYGIIIATEKNAEVKAVFDGVVSRIMIIKRANPVVMIKHGDYNTVYKNLGKVFVKPGDKISTGQVIGEVFTNSRTQESHLGFGVYKNSSTENPQSWLAPN